jgi:hypothetical protein
VSDGTSLTESSHLRVHFPAGDHYGTSFGFDFADMGIAEPVEVYFRYAIRLGPAWTTDGGGGGKLPGFGGTYGVAGWGGTPSDGTNGWSARGLFWDPPQNPASGDTRIGYYAYHADMPGQYGDNWFFSGGSLGADGILQRGQWYQIEMHVVLNTPGQNDGVLEAWADGTQVYEKTDIRFRDVDTLKVEQVWFDNYYGGSWTIPADMYIDYDNAVISWSYIGPVSNTPGTGGGGAGGSGGSANGGSGGASSGGASNGGSGGAPGSGASAGAAAEGSEDEGGCGCRLAGEREHPFAALFAALLALSLASRRRRAA